MSARINLEEILKQLPERPFSDFIGKGTLPAGFLGGVETFRAIQNSFDPAIPLPKEAVKMFLVIKLCSAKSNKALKTVDDDIADAIIKACESLLEGENIELLPASPLFQTGSCTSLNMLANESLALLASYFVNDSTWAEDLNSLPINPNDHINKSQSSNDTSPTALRIMIYKQIKESFI
ncbi:MAG: lyase family protein, partial [Thermodesulfobacteriota bacterium]